MYFQKNRLAILGGSDHKNAIKRILTYIATDNLLTKYNWSGTGKQKRKSFKHLENVVKVIKGELIYYIAFPPFLHYTDRFCESSRTDDFF